MEFLHDILAKALDAVGLPAKLAIVLRSDRPDIADFQCNAAMAGARLIGREPQELAQAVVDAIEDPRVQASVAGRGYINLKVDNALLVSELSSPHPLPIKHQTKIIDYGGPNVAKAMHVGHLRSLVIGTAIKNILRWQGYDAVSDIHWGDWGYQMGLVLSGLTSDGFANESGQHPLTIEHLQELYPKAAAWAKANSKFHQDSQDITVALQNGDPYWTNIWQNIVRVTRKSVEADLDTLNITFDSYNGESTVNHLLPVLEQVLGQSGILSESDGAQVIELSGLTPLMFKNSAGGYLYGATDLATIHERQSLDPVEIIYVVDQRQELHFKQVFKAAQLIGHNTTLTHAGFGTVQGADGKPLKTRAGGVPTLRGLMDEAITKALDRIEDPEAARKIAMSAIKFNDLQNKRSTNYVYDLEKAMSHEGKTGPYLLYQIVRIKSIMAKAVVRPGPIVISNDDERQLILTLMNFRPTIDKAATNLHPHLIAEYLYSLAQMFSSFYGNHKVSDDSSRLSLVTYVYQTLATGLMLLGIETVEAM